jgi:uncharacterized membrane protein YczE
MVRSTLGLAPWDVFHQGLTRHVPITLGQAIVATSFVLLLLWIPLREKPGVGTIGNAVIVGLSVDATLALLPAPEEMGWRVLLLVAGVAGNGLATAMYIGAQLGRGPRDGLMTGIVARFPRLSIRLVRTALELTVLGLGWLLGGTVGLGTLAFALSIGPLAQLFIPMFTVPAAHDAPVPVSAH